MKIAILGASGIGKSHARWFASHGCEVVSILGSSDDSAAQTGAALAADFGFAGLTYSNLTALLHETQPDAVCVATPSTQHFMQSLECLEAGVHVLCEKPLVYAPTRKMRENLDGAKELVRLARKKKLVLATQLQYGAATPILCKLAGTTPPEVGDFAMELETANPHAPRETRELWMDLGPHPLSVAQFLAGEGAKIVEESLRVMRSQSEHQSEITARFSVSCPNGRLLTCRAILRALDATIDRKPVRRFAFNGRVVTYNGVIAPDGTYGAQYTAPDGYDNLHRDPVSYLIGDFLHAIRERQDPLISGEFGMQNLEWLLKMANDGMADGD
ncbi:MAG: Gfo/Idh/MocA family oxidoreductase [Armatimonadetes bacterium]|nr:Gfo/Idh/MocA family oxidoreductase [Armatimonadota bacterium]